jgi:hypothetical protein
MSILSSTEKVHEKIISIGTSHPRLCAQTDTLPADMGKCEPFINAMIKESSALMEVPPLTRIMDGRRLLSVSREALRRISILAIAWMRTRNPDILKRAEEEMLAVCSFTDWNTSHYLDTAEMSLGVALGYDWLYNALSPEVREKIAEGLWKLGLETAVEEAFWQKNRNNWGQVCNAGAIAAALALAERHPETASFIVTRAFKDISIPMETYAPDGFYPEGPMYWEYGTSFNIVFLMLIESVFGTMGNLEKKPGFVESALYMQHITAPSGKFFNFADSRISGGLSSSILWFADNFGTEDGGLLKITWNALKKTPELFLKDRLAPLILVFGLKDSIPSKADPGAPSLDIHGRGQSELVVMRSAWDDQEAWYVGIKSGTPSASHGHMDGGSFILEAGGVRWAEEAGSETYGLLEQKGFDLWNGAQDGPRWDVFRYGNLSHNILVINGERQLVSKSASVSLAELNVQNPHATVDLSALYARDIKRKFKFKGRNSLTIADSIGDLKHGDSIRWQMLTSASVAVGGSVLTLTQDGRAMKITTTENIQWKVTEAADMYREWDTPQENMRVVSFELSVSDCEKLEFETVFELVG